MHTVFPRDHRCLLIRSKTLLRTRLPALNDTSHSATPTGTRCLDKISSGGRKNGRRCMANAPQAPQLRPDTLLRNLHNGLQTPSLKCETVRHKAAVRWHLTPLLRQGATETADMEQRGYCAIA